MEAACQVLLSTCGDLPALRDPTPSETESQKANPFIPKAQTEALLKHARHLLAP